ncbi:MAG TPA: ATP-binding cassette domain-containing protein [Verrucomicrobiae bacterium]|jgi:ABC-2 type transport system ATP-binding protein|nr:ATP-binding cassette domain-containing protein [Verrucomicrobiae bacterium]
MLAIDHVHKEFGKVRAVQDVSFRVDDGVTFGLIGPNGAGKTTTMRMILGILTPDGGSIAWNGKPVDGSMRRRCGYLPEERGLYAKMKVSEQIAFFGRLHGLVEPEITKRTDAWIERLGIGQYADRPCSELSKGNQQKVQVACAAVHDPELLVLDEAFSGLDPVNADMLLNILNELKAQGTTLILSSHQMWQLEALCSRFCIISAGENRASGTLDELRAAWPTRILRVAPGSSAVRAMLERVEGAFFVADNDGRFDYSLPANTDFAATLRSLVGVEAVTSFEVIEPSLHDIYIRASEQVPA